MAIAQYNFGLHLNLEQFLRIVCTSSTLDRITKQLILCFPIILVTDRAIIEFSRKDLWNQPKGYSEREDRSLYTISFNCNPRKRK